jgi:lipoprotein signal peptidase
MNATAHRPVLWGAAVIAADQITKFATSAAGCGPVICPLRNDALFLGLGDGSGVDAFTIGLAGVVLFAAWVFVARRYATVPAIAIALVVAGIAANGFDRLLLGSVRDFLAMPGGIVINLADVADVGGLLACVASVLRSRTHLRPISERG